MSIGTISVNEIYTKRQVISDIARTFDVLGWFSPVTILMKIMFQKLWELKLEWDEEVPHHIQEQHSLWRSQLHILKDIPFNRCYYRATSEVIQTELHGFCDASEDAYAAVVYMRATYKQEPPTLALVVAKTKVAPLKRQSIPRLECGAQLLAKLLSNVRNALQIGILNCYAWTDSTIVLHWLDGSPRRFKTFVGNRVSAILDHLPAKTWRHVPTTSNPADCASRGLLPNELIRHSLWWKGPDWLLTEPPESLNSALTDTLEFKVTCNTVSPDSQVFLEEKFSSFTKLIRINALIHHFIANLKAKKLGKILNLSQTLSTKELEESELQLLARSQKRSFPDELQKFHSGDHLKSSSSLLPLNPKLGSCGLLTVGGRLNHSSLSHSQRHPIILHRSDILTRLIVSFNISPSYMLVALLCSLL